jgi:hypothetical protein
MEVKEYDGYKLLIKCIFWTSTILTLFIASCCYIVPQYGVYEQRLKGQARLQEAESSRQIAVVEAEAKKIAATQLALAEIERAKGVAQANTIIADSLKNNESYLRYLWIQGLENGKSEVIYIPTEAGLPILEAQRLKK